MKRKKKKSAILKYGHYTSSSFYYPSFMDMKDPYFVRMRDKFFADQRRNNKRYSVKTTYRIPYSDSIILDDNSLDNTLTLLQ